MIFRSFLLVFAFFALVAADYIKPLSQLNVNYSYNLVFYDKVVVFVSASIDDPEVLKQIVLTDGNGKTKTALELKNGFVFRNSDLKNGWITNGPISVLVTADNHDVANLQGLIYFNDMNALNGRKLFVYDVTQTNHISLPSSNSASQLLIVLNTLQNSKTLISDWKQRSPQNASIYLDYYLDKKDNSQDRIFTNPIYFDGVISSQNPYRFEHVEPFYLKMSCFHALINGGARFTLSPGSIDEHNVTTTKVTTTGVITKGVDELYFDRTVTFLKSTQIRHKGGFSGYQALIYDVFDTVTINMVVNSTDHKSDMSSLSATQKIYGGLGDRIQASSMRSQFYYVQYFNVEFS